MLFFLCSSFSQRLVFKSWDCFSVVVQWGLQHDGRPQLFLKPFVFWSATVYYSCLSVMLRRTCLLWRRLGESLMWMTFSHFMLGKKRVWFQNQRSVIWKKWPIIYPYKRTEHGKKCMSNLELNPWLNNDEYINETTFQWWEQWDHKVSLRLI